MSCGSVGFGRARAGTFTSASSTAKPGGYSPGQPPLRNHVSSYPEIAA